MAKRFLYSNFALVISTLLMGPLAFASSLQIDVTLTPAGSFKAQTKKVTGTVHRTADGIEAEDVTIDLKTLDTGIALRDKHTKDYLLVSKHPQAKLIKASGKDGKGTATIEIRGKKTEVAGTYKIEGKKVKVEFPMKLSDIEITGVRYMGVGVKDEVKVHLELPLADAKRTAASVKKVK
jgi:hypothetical protein